MAFTAKLGISDSKPGNIPPGLGANAVTYLLYSGVYTLTSGKLHDTLYLSINYPNSQIQDVPIPNPFIELSPITDQLVSSPFIMPKVGQ